MLILYDIYDGIILLCGQFGFPYGITPNIYHKVRHCSILLFLLWRTDNNHLIVLSFVIVSQSWSGLDTN